MLITIEGLPLSGKKTQQKFLVDQLKQWDFDPVATTCEAGWNKETSGILKYMAVHGNTTPVEKLFLFLADRAGHFARFIRPIFQYGGQGYLNQETGRPSNKPVVISVGGPDSTVAYQGFGQDVAPIKDIVRMNDIAMQGLKIDATFILDIPVEEMIERAPLSSRDKHRTRGLEFYERVRQGYQQIAEVESDRVHLIEASGSEEDVFIRLKDAMARLLESKGL